MRHAAIVLALLAGCATAERPQPSAAAGPFPAPASQDGKLRIIAFGAHPDDCEIQEGGSAAKWAAMALPMPRPPPVTSAVLPASEMVVVGMGEAQVVCEAASGDGSDARDMSDGNESGW